MSQEFADLGALAMHLMERKTAELIALHHGLDNVLVHIETVAKSEIGHYQPEAGPFPAWAELADSTEEEKARLGYPLGAPLERTRALADSIGHEVDGLEGVVGSTSEVMVFHEFGTSKMPPRPVLGPAAYRERPRIMKILGIAAVSGLIGEDRVHAALGYDFKTGSLPE